MIGSGSRGTDSTAVGQGMAPGVSIVASPGKEKINGSEAKIIQHLVKAMDSMSFDEKRFGALLSMSSATFQRRLLRILYSYVCNLAEKCERGLWLDDEEMELYVEGARMRDAMRPFM